jgi:hypothetical protein
LAHTLVTQPAAPGLPKASKHRLSQICNAPPLGDSYITALEDPFETLFTEAITFFGGSFLVFPGTVEGSTFTTKCLAKAIFLNERSPMSPEFSKSSHEAFSIILSISDEMAGRAGIARGSEPVARPGQGIKIPALSELEQLKKCVSFSFEEMEALLSERGLEVDALRPFVLDVGEGSLESIDEQEGPLTSRPIVRTTDGFILAAPGLLLPALRHRVVTAAREWGLLDDLADRFTDACWHDVLESLRSMGLDRVDIEPMGGEGLSCHRDGFFAIDTDKLLYAQLLCDDLGEYTDRVFGEWHPTGLIQRLQDRAQRAEMHAFSISAPANEMLALYLVTSPGRSFFAGLTGSESPDLLLQPDELSVIAQVEGRDPLALLRYARASSEVRQQVHLLAFNQLDEYQVFRRQHYSYYLSDERQPTAINIAPGSGLALRVEAQRKRDSHGILWYQRGFHTEVTSLYDDQNIPLYVSLHDTRWAIAIEGLPQVVWVVSSTRRDESVPLYGELVETVAYWIWQLTPVVASVLRQYGREPVVFVIDVDDPEAWLGVTGENLEAYAAVPGDPISYQVRAHDGAILLRLNLALLPLLSTQDNAGERLLVASIMSAFWDLVSTAGGATDELGSQEDLQSVVDQYAPLGLKKKIILLSSAASPDLDPTGLPPYIKVHPYDEGRVLDEVGEYASDRLPEGPVSREKRGDVLNSVVRFLYTSMQALIRTLDGPQLLDWLIAHNEAITRHIAYRRLTIPTRLACFASEEEVIKQLNEEMPQANKAALASRFLIEYVAACPPRGIRPISYSTYGRLLALASAIFNFGQYSDLIHYGIADLGLTMLGSGRLGVDLGDYDKGQAAYQALYSGSAVRHAEITFGRYWRTENKDDNGLKLSDEDANTLDISFAAEFGFTLRDFASLIAEATSVGWERDEPVSKRPTSDLHQALQERLAWPDDRLRDALHLLTVFPRADFLTPPAPYKRDDVYPWRFNRSLSYLRTPFIAVEPDGKHEVWWGSRHLRAAGPYLLDLFLTGRLKNVRTQEMKRAISNFRRRETNAFNDLVAGLFEGAENVKVRRRLRKIGAVRIGGADRDLGDIDVLAANARTGSLLVIECKDLEVARTPQELANELETLFKGTRSNEAAATRHQLRAVWVTENLQLALNYLSLPAGRRWKVKALVAVDEELFSAHLYPSPVPVMSYHHLKSVFVPDWLR